MCSLKGNSVQYLLYAIILSSSMHFMKHLEHCINFVLSQIFPQQLTRFPKINIVIGKGPQKFISRDL